MATESALVVLTVFCITAEVIGVCDRTNCGRNAACISGICQCTDASFKIAVGSNNHRFCLQRCSMINSDCPDKTGCNLDAGLCMCLDGLSLTHLGYCKGENMSTILSQTSSPQTGVSAILSQTTSPQTGVSATVRQTSSPQTGVSATLSQASPPQTGTVPHNLAVGLSVGLGGFVILVVGIVIMTLIIRRRKHSRNRNQIFGPAKNTFGDTNIEPRKEGSATTTTAWTEISVKNKDVLASHKDIQHRGGHTHLTQSADEEVPPTDLPQTKTKENSMGIKNATCRHLTTSVPDGLYPNHQIPENKANQIIEKQIIPQADKNQSDEYSSLYACHLDTASVKGNEEKIQSGATGTGSTFIMGTDQDKNADQNSFMMSFDYSKDKADDYAYHKLQLPKV